MTQLPNWTLKTSRLLVFGNLWVAFCAVSLYWCTALLHKLEIEVFLSLSIFNATVFIYNYHRLFRKKVIYEKVRSERHEWILMHEKELQILALITLISAIGFFVPYMNIRLFLRFSPFLALALFYVIPIWKRRGKWLRVRDIPFIKIFLVAAVWSFVTVVLPFLADDPEWLPNVEIWHTIVQRFIYIFAITVPFDIRDLKLDKASGLTTFAGRFGVSNAKRISEVLLLIVAIICLSAAHLGFYTYGNALGMLLSCSVTGLLISRIDENSSEWIYAGLLDGTMLDQFLWVLILGSFLVF
jgi:4-hydroxybenzoate polyprenyltransferase